MDRRTVTFGLLVLLMVLVGCEREAVPAADPLAYTREAGVVLVRFAEAQAEAVGIERFGPPELNLYRVRVGDVADSLALLGKDDAILYAEPNYAYHAFEVPDDPLFGDLWGMDNARAPEAWDLTTEGAKVIGLDTGIDYRHEDLSPWVNEAERGGQEGVDDDGNGWIDDVHGIDVVNGDGDPFDDHGHGTHTAGTVGAVGNNTVGVVGVSWGNAVGSCKFLSEYGSGYAADAADCLVYAVAQGFTVSNNSWGGGARSQVLYDVIEWAGRQGHLFVASAGNTGRNTDEYPVYPGSYDLPNVLTVAALQEDDNLASFSCWGPESVDLAAPGYHVLSTMPNNAYLYMSGTSMAAPHVTGAAALVRELRPEWGAEQVKAHLLAHVRPLAALGGKVASGGTLDLYATLSELGPGPTPTATSPGPTSTAPIPPPTDTPPIPTLPPVTTATVSIESASVSPGDVFYTDVAVENLWRAGAHQMIVDYDSDVITVALDLFEFGTLFDGDDVIDIGPDDSQGYLAFAQLDYRLNEYSGDGLLARVAWQAVAEGDSPLHFRVEGDDPPLSYFLTYDSERPPAVFADGLVKVQVPTSTPTSTPSSTPTSTKTPTSTPTSTRIPTRTPRPTVTPQPTLVGGWVVVVRGFKTQKEAELWAQHVKDAWVTRWPHLPLSLREP